MIQNRGEGDHAKVATEEEDTGLGMKDEDMFYYTGTQEEEEELWNQHLEFVSTPRTQRDSTRMLSDMRNEDDAGLSTLGKDDPLTHYVGGDDHPPLHSGSKDVPETPGYPRSSKLSLEDDWEEDDFWEWKTTLMEDDQDDFWENPLSHLSMGETPEPTSKVPRSILCNRSQGVS